MILNKDEFLKAMNVHNYSITSCAQAMGISREYLWYILEEKRKPGNKFISGIRKAFPAEPIDKFLVNS